MGGKYDIYICYSRNDIDKARLLKSALDGRGYTSFFDMDDIGVGELFAESIINAIDNSSVFLYIHTPHCSNSIWIDKELYYAINRDMPIIPVVFEGEESMDNKKMFLLAAIDWSVISLGCQFSSSILNLISRLNSVFSEINGAKTLSKKGVK